MLTVQFYTPSQAHVIMSTVSSHDLATAPTVENREGQG